MRRPWQGDESKDAAGGHTGKISRGRHQDFLDVLHDQRPDITPEPAGWEGQRGRQASKLPKAEPTPAQVEAWKHKLKSDNPSLREVGRRMGIDHATVKEHLTQALGDDDIEAARERMVGMLRDRAAERFIQAIWGKPQVGRGGG